MSSGSTSYFHPDHLGPTSVLTTSSGVKEQDLVYYPYGETFTNTGTANVACKYTGKELDDSTGLYFYEARYYDAVLGRFISADTIVPSTTDPQAFNRYTYARNNPIIFNDASGHFFKKAFKKIKNAVNKSIVGRIAGWVVAPVIMQYLDRATSRYAIAGTAVMGGAAVGGAGIWASYGVYGGIIGGAYGGAFGAAGSALDGQHVNFGRAILTGTAGGVTTSLRGGRFELGVAFSGGTAFEQNEENFVIRVDKKHQSLQILIRLKKPATVVLPRTTVTITGNGKSNIFHLEKMQMKENFQSIRGGQLRDIPLQDPVNLQNDSPTGYYLFYPLDLENTKEFSLSIPPFFVNDQEIVLPPIYWTLVEESFFLEKTFIWNC